MATKTEGSETLTAEAFAWVPDPESPSTWKLRIDDARHVAGAVAALGPGGFRGQKVQIPQKDLAAAKRRVLAAWKKFHPGQDAPESLTKGEPMADTVVEDRISKLEEDISQLASKADEIEKAKKKPMMDKPMMDEEEMMEEETKKGEDVSKRFDEISKKYEELSKKFEETNAKLAAAEEVAKAELDKREKIEFAKRAESAYPNLPGTAEEKGNLLQALSKKLGADEFQKIEALLAAGNEAMKQVTVGKGSDAPATGSAETVIEKKAEALAKEEKLPLAQAWSEVLKREPELYTRYLNEKERK